MEWNESLTRLICILLYGVGVRTLRFSHQFLLIVTVHRQPHRRGNRVATMVVYCDVPEVGGATQFRNSGIHLKPKVGMATFFSYMGSDGVMDDGFTEHSGCPVLKGDKRIVTQWMRKGVDEKNPWDSFNTCKLASLAHPSALNHFIHFFYLCDSPQNKL